MDEKVERPQFRLNLELLLARGRGVPLNFKAKHGCPFLLVDRVDGWHCIAIRGVLGGLDHMCCGEVVVKWKGREGRTCVEGKGKRGKEIFPLYISKASPSHPFDGSNAFQVLVVCFEQFAHNIAIPRVVSVQIANAPLADLIPAYFSP